jgi:quercetin dioxygenase-like cupin family protein
VTTVQTDDLAPAIEGSALALSGLRMPAGSEYGIANHEHDTLLFAFAGSGSLTLEGETRALVAGTACLVLAGEEARLDAGSAELHLICATIGPETDRHAPIGAREIVVALDHAGSEKATGARSFQILFGPHNGSTRATLFAGYIPPGKAPWHYHLYDEIVWVPEGPGRLHIGEMTEELGAGSTFRLRPRQVHIVENLSPSQEMTIIGIFTPAGSPSAAYLTPDVAAEYRFAG